MYSEQELLQKREAYFSKYNKFEKVKRVKKVKKESVIKSESQEQIDLCFRLNKNNYIFSKIGNDTWTSSWASKLKNINEGSSKGLLDMMILLKNKTFLFIELKRQGIVLKNGNISHSNSKVSYEQDVWLGYLNSMNSCKAIVCYGCDESIKVIEEMEKL